MALEKCRECGHDVSSTSPRCPHCGFAMINQRPVGNTIAGYIGAFLLIWFVVVYGSKLWIAVFQ